MAGGSPKQYTMDFVLSAQISSQYNQAFKAANQELKQMQSEIMQVSSAQKDISSYQKQQSAVEHLRERYAELKAEYDTAQQEMSETGKSSEELGTDYELLVERLEKARASLVSQEQKLETVGDKLKDAHVDVENLGEAYESLSQKSEGLKAEQEKVAQEFENSGESAGIFGDKSTEAVNAVQQALVAAGIVKLLQEVSAWFRECVDASIEFESAVTGVAKTTDLTTAELAEMSAEIKRLLTEIPITTSELSAVAEVAGQLGIAKEDLLDFSTVMSMLATATTMTADEAATMLAQFANITQMEAQYYDELASAIVELGNSYATTEQKITEMSQGIAASASLAGMAEADMLGIAAAVTSLGIETAAGSTSISKLISELMTAVETGSDSLQEYAKVANMTAEEFAQAWGEDAAGAMEKFVTGLSDTDRMGQSAIVTLQELGITETRMQRAVLSLSNSGDLLSNSITTANQAWEENTALQNEAEKRYATTQSLLTMLDNSYNNLKISVGDVFTPALRELAEVGTDTMNGLAGMVEKYPEIVSLLSAAAVAVGVFSAALAAYTVIAAAAKIATDAFKAAWDKVPVFLIASGVIAIVSALAVFVKTLKQTEDETKELSAVSRAQYYELQQLEEEYAAVCQAQGETSKAARELQAEITAATAAFEENKVTAQELAQAHEDAMNAYQEFTDAFAESNAELDSEREKITYLIDSLEELSGIEGKSAAKKQLILSMVNSLNESLPELGLAYDENADSINNSVVALRAYADAEARKKANETNLSQLKQRSEKVVELEKAQASAAQEAAAAQEELNAARKEASAAFRDNERAIEQLSEELAEYKAGIEGAASASEAIYLTIAELDALGEAYGEVYHEAYESFQGQFGLLDELSMKAEFTYADMINAQKTQAKAWEKYAENLKKAADWGYDDAFLQQFTSGSLEDMQMLNVLINSGTDAIADYYEAWERTRASMGTAADAVAELDTDYSAQVEQLAESLTAAFSEMGLSEQAAQQAREFVTQYLEGLEDEDLLEALAGSSKHLGEVMLSAISGAVQEPGELETTARNGLLGALESGMADISPLAQDYGKDATLAFSEASAAQEQLAEVTAAYQEVAAAAKEELDIAEDAANAGTMAVEGFISAAQDRALLGRVTSAYSIVAQTAADAINRTLEIHSPSRVTQWSAEMATAGFIQPATDPSTLAEVNRAYGEMSNVAAQATVPAQGDYGAIASTLSVVNSPQELQGVSNYSYESSGGTIEITLSPSYQLLSGASQESEEIMERNNEHLKQLILDVLEENGIDAERVRFR